MTVVQLDPAALDRLVPLALIFDGDGRIVHTGPTLAKLVGAVTGRALTEVVAFVKPQVPRGNVMALAGRRLRLDLRGPGGAGPDPVTGLRGMVLPLADGAGLLTMALGANPAPVLERHTLTAADFSEVDPIVDFLYQMEAHALLLTEFERLSERLDRARAAALRDAVTDKLTGLHNRRAMDDRLARLSQGKGVNFGLMQLDLDHFKAVNDTLGHAAGDHVLEAVAAILREEVRAGDMVARIGGDEFMLLFAGCDDVAYLQAIADRIIARLEQPIDWRGHICRISGSIGITLSQYYEILNPDRLVSDVDAALYLSKRGGRARASVVDRAMIHASEIAGEIT